MSSRSKPSPRSRSPADDEVPDQLLRQFRMLLSVVKAHFQTIERTVGLGGAQVWALSVVSEHPGMGVGELARVLNVRQPTASNLVKSLAEAGLLTISRNREDRRLSHLHVTPDGLKRLAKVPGPLSGVLPDALRRLDAHKAAALRDHLDELLLLLEVDQRDATQPLARL